MPIPSATTTATAGRMPGGDEPRLPISQRRPLDPACGATAVMNIISAEQKELTATPESISAVGGSAPAPEARRQTRPPRPRRRRRPPPGPRGRRRPPVVSTNTAPSAAPPETPSM